MNKQELIRKYEEEKNGILDFQNSDGWKDEGLLKQNSSVTALRWVFDFVEDLKKLKEPEKVKIPDFVGMWLHYCKGNNYPLCAAVDEGNMHSYERATGREGLSKWFFDSKENQDLFAQAWANDYEKEKLKYRINIGGLYLREPLGDTNDFTIKMTWNKDYAYPFNSWDMARKHTSELGGTIEEVWQ